MTEDVMIEERVDVVDQDGAVIHVGVTLRHAREQVGLQQEDIAKELRLSLQTIKDIETNSYHHSYALTYVKGYLRGYARLVNLPADPLLAQFIKSDWAQQRASEPLIRVQPLSTPFERSPKQARKRQHVARWVGLLLLLGLMVLVATWWHGQKRSSHLNSQNKPLLALPSQAPAPAVTSVAASQLANPKKG